MDFGQIDIRDNNDSCIPILLEVCNTKFQELFKAHHGSDLGGDLLKWDHERNIIKVTGNIIDCFHIIASDDEMTHMFMGFPEEIYISDKIVYLLRGFDSAYDVQVPAAMNMSFSYLNNICRCIFRCHHITEVKKSTVHVYGMINIIDNIEFIPEDTLIDIAMKVACNQDEHFKNVYLTNMSGTGILRQLEKFGCINTRTNKELKKFCSDLYINKKTVYEFFQAIYIKLEPHKIHKLQANQ